MNERKTNVEIGDVLSSVRRLISGEVGLASSLLTPQSLSSVAVQAAGQSGLTRRSRLLLTPALRVWPEDFGESTPEPRLSEVVARLGASTEGDWEAEVTDPPGADPEPVWAPAVTEITPQPGSAAEILTFRSSDETRLRAAWRDGALAEPPNFDEIPEAPFAEVSEDEAEFTLHSFAASAPVEHPPEQEQAAPDDAGFGPPPQLSRVNDPAGQRVLAGQRVFAPEDGDDFDEEALREVIRDLIREELSGVMGQRITRNIRKMVRAEIRRTLTAELLSGRGPGAPPSSHPSQ